MYGTMWSLMILSRNVMSVTSSVFKIMHIVINAYRIDFVSVRLNAACPLALSTSGVDCASV